MTKTKEQHGCSRTAEYKLWINIIGRCTNDKTPYYHNYGARGVGICEQWRNSFSVFLADVGRKPGANYSLDRIDNDKGYEPGNVRWANKKAQSHNMRKNVILQFGGVSQTLTAWAEQLGLAPSTLHYRLSPKGGMSVEEALTTPRRCGRHPSVTQKRTSVISYIDCTPNA